MSHSKHQASDRRTFLRDASILSVAAAGFAGLQQTVAAQDAASNQLETIDLGAKPGVFALGTVVVVKTNYLYVTFQATNYGEDGSATGDGVAVIQLQDCAARRNRFPGDEDVPTHPIDIESLGACETYEVHNSSWAEGDSMMRHFIFTFIGFVPGVSERVMNFECLARNANGYFLETESFEDVLDYIDVLESLGPPSEQVTEENANEDTSQDDYYSDSYEDESYSDAEDTSSEDSYYEDTYPE